MSIPLSIHNRLPKKLPLSYGFSRYGVQFDGATQTLETADIAMSGDRTWIIYFTPLFNYNDGANHMISEWRPLATRRMFVYKNINNQIYFVHDSTFDGGAYASINILRTFLSGKPHCIAVVADITTTKVTIYWDGVIGLSTIIAGMVSLGGVDEFSVAGINVGYSPMIVHEILGYNRALTQNEIVRNMLDYHNPTRANLFLFVRCEEGVGLTAADLSGVGNNMSLLPAVAPPLWVRDKKWALRAEANL